MGFINNQLCFSQILKVFLPANILYHKWNNCFAKSMIETANFINWWDWFQMLNYWRTSLLHYWLQQSLQYKMEIIKVFTWHTSWKKWSILCLSISLHLCTNNFINYLDFFCYSIISIIKYRQIQKNKLFLIL